MVKKAAEDAMAQVGAAAASLNPPSAPAPAAPDRAADSPGAAVGGACAKAADCCRKFIQKSKAGAQAQAGCSALEQLADATCEQPLQTYRQSAKLLGVNCD